jgi:hypothetical protein
MRLSSSVAPPWGPRDQRADSDHCGEVEQVRAEHDAEADITLTTHDRGDRRGELRTIRSKRRQDTNQRFRETELSPEPIEPCRERRGRAERHGEGHNEAGGSDEDVERRHGEPSPTRLPGTPPRDTTPRGARVRVLVDHERRWPPEPLEYQGAA